jgi:hypothetical protein
MGIIKREIRIIKVASTLLHFLLKLPRHFIYTGVFGFHESPLKLHLEVISIVVFAFRISQTILLLCCTLPGRCGDWCESRSRSPICFTNWQIRADPVVADGCWTSIPLIWHPAVGPFLPKNILHQRVNVVILSHPGKRLSAHSSSVIHGGRLCGQICRWRRGGMRLRKTLQRLSGVFVLRQVDMSRRSDGWV